MINLNKRNSIDSYYSCKGSLSEFGDRNEQKVGNFSGNEADRNSQPQNSPVSLAIYNDLRKMVDRNLLLRKENNRLKSVVQKLQEEKKKTLENKEKTGEVYNRCLSLFSSCPYFFSSQK